MSDPTPAPAPEPQHGGSFVRDAETGALQCVQRSLTEAEQGELAALAEQAPPPPAEPEPQE